MASLLASLRRSCFVAYVLTHAHDCRARRPLTADKSYRKGVALAAIVSAALSPIVVKAKELEATDKSDAPSPPSPPSPPSLPLLSSSSLEDSKRRKKEEAKRKRLIDLLDAKNSKEDHRGALRLLLEFTADETRDPRVSYP